MKLSILLLLLAPAIQAAVLAIDYGAEFTKLSLVKPGVPFDVVLDKDSKRKIQSVVGWKRDERVFGQEGKMTATRFPDAHYPYVKPLLASSSIPSLPLYPTPPTIVNNTLMFPHKSAPAHITPSPSWTPTALLAHQLSYFRSLAEALHPAGSPIEPITQVIVTVPSWWTQAQRRAYRDALDLQGLTCLAMIGEGTGVALNYAMTRSFPTTEYHIVYDSGAMQTTATVVAFYQSSYLPSPKSKTLVNTTHIEILGTGWEEVGGVMLDLAIQDQLVEMFKKASGHDVRSDARAMAKLSREAARVKHILSANQDSAVNVESLYNDKDLRGRLSRSALEDAITPLMPQFTSPITSALASANLTLTNITDIILFGGNTRVPLVHSAVSEFGAPIAQNVNTDEAAVLGAAYYGAGLSRLFKMKNIDVIERSVHPVTMGDQVIFEKGTRLGERKSLQLPPTENLTIEFAQASAPVLSVTLVDIPAALSNFTGSNPVVNLTMRLDARGHLATANAVLVSGNKAGMADAIKGLFGKAKEDEEEDTPVKVALKFREKHLVKPMTGEEKRITQARLNQIATFESAKVAREEARNFLEGYLYRLQNLLTPEAENRALHEFATDSERKVLGTLLTETFEWLGDEAERADEATLRAKRLALEKLESPIIIRFSEWQTRGKAIEDFQKAMFNSRAFLVEATKNRTEALEAVAASTPESPVAPPKYTESELEGVKDMLKENEVWVDDLMKVQIGLEEEMTSDPVIFTKDLDERGKQLQNTVLRLVGKKAPRAPRPIIKKPQPSSNETETESDSAPEAEVEAEAEASSSKSSGSTPEATETVKIPPHEEL